MAVVVAVDDDDVAETYDIWNREADCYMPAGKPPSGGYGNFVIDGLVVHNSILANQSYCFEDLMLFNAMGHPGPMACVRSDSKIDTDAGQIRIDELAGSGTRLAYLTTNGDISYTDNYKVVESGRKKLVKLTLADGRILVVSPDHRILTTSGYKPAGTLTTEDEVVCGD